MRKRDYERQQSKSRVAEAKQWNEDYTAYETYDTSMKLYFIKAVATKVYETIAYGLRDYQRSAFQAGMEYERQKKVKK